MRFVGQAYRAHNPVWSAFPLSGDGAARHGGRFNPKGVAALYLGLTIDGAVAEASQGFAFKLQPLTICLYEIDCEDIVDLKHEAGRERVGVSSLDLACPWALDLAEGRWPASWAVAQRLIDSGAAGVLVPSYARGAKRDAVNLVLWRWSAALPHRVLVHDPSGRLPRNLLSWS